MRPRPEGYRGTHPRPQDILWVIEVADTSLRDDRERKLPLYAQAGVPEVWLVNLPERAIEVLREPRAGSYSEVRTARRGETVSPLAFPGMGLRVDDILG